MVPAERSVHGEHDSPHHYDELAATRCRQSRRYQASMRSRAKPTSPIKVSIEQRVPDVAAKSLFARADTPYVGANIPGKPRVDLAYLGGDGIHRKTCSALRANGYEGFILETEAGDLTKEQG